MSDPIDSAPPPSDDHDESPSLDARDEDLDLLCERWVAWCRTRHLYAAQPSSSASLGRLGGGTRPLRPTSEVAISSATLAALHIAYTCQPNALDKQVFDLYYVVRVKPIKAAAAALGIGRTHFYRVLIDFRRRLDQAARAIADNGISHEYMPIVKDESVSSRGDKTDP